MARASDRVLTVEIVDDGSGRRSGSMGSGRGLRNMKARAEALGAEIRFESGAPGYRVLLRVPVPAPAPPSASATGSTPVSA